MKVTRKTIAHYSPQDSSHQMNVKLMVKKEGELDLAMLVTIRKGRQYEAVKDQLDTFTKELTYQLLKGYKIKVSDFGSFMIEIDSKSVPYEDAKKLNKDSIKKFKVKFTPSCALKKRFEDARKSVDIC